jgi:hypothetical protein
MIKYNRPLNFEILTRSLTVYVKKNIIKYIKTFNSDNVTICFYFYVKDHKNLKDTITLYTDSSSRYILIYHPKYIIKFVSTSYQKPKVILDVCSANYKILKDNQGFDNTDANADKIHNINTKYLNICLVFGLVLSLGAPSLIYYFTGVNLYDKAAITESIYSKSLIDIRITCATVFISSIILLWHTNINKLSIFNKPIL